MITIYDIPQKSDEWFSLRLGSLGASSVKDAMAQGQGKVRKALAYKLISEQITGVKVNGYKSEAMEEGNNREPESRAYFEFVTGIELEEVGLITHKDYPGCHCSPDGINRDSGIGFEVKNPEAHTHVKRLHEDRCPPEYYPQIQFSLMITGWDLWYFMSYHPAFEKQLILPVYRDEEYIAEMQGKLEVFFNEMADIKELVK